MTTALRAAHAAPRALLLSVLALGCHVAPDDPNCDSVDSGEDAPWSVVGHSVVATDDEKIDITIDLAHDRGLTPRRVWALGQPLKPEGTSPANGVWRYTGTFRNSTIEGCAKGGSDNGAATDPAVKVSDACNGDPVLIEDFTCFSEFVGGNITVSYPGSPLASSGGVTLLPATGVRTVRLQSEGLGEYTVGVADGPLVVEPGGDGADGCVWAVDGLVTNGVAYTAPGGIDRFELRIDPEACVAARGGALPATVELLASRSGIDASAVFRFVPGPSLIGDAASAPFVAPDPGSFAVTAGPGLSLSSCTLRAAPTGVTVKRGATPLELLSPTTISATTATFGVSFAANAEAGLIELSCVDTLEQRWDGTFAVEATAQSLLLRAPALETDDEGGPVASSADPVLLRLESTRVDEITLSTGAAALWVPRSGDCTTAETGASAVGLMPASWGEVYEGTVCHAGPSGVHLIRAQQGLLSAELRITVVEAPVFEPDTISLAAGVSAWINLPPSLDAELPETTLRCTLVGSAGIRVYDPAPDPDVTLSSAEREFTAAGSLLVSLTADARTGDSARLTCTDTLGERAELTVTVAAPSAP